MKLVHASLRAVRDGWLILGATLLLFLAVESLLRMQAAVGHAWGTRHPKAAVPSPLAAADWYLPYLREFNDSRQVQWTPYVYIRRPPFQGRYITVDSLGHRVTPQVVAAGAPAERLFFFGGSTLWGSYQRDAYTIPAVAAKRVAEAGLPKPVAITNFGESAYVFTQEVLELILQLRAGNVPDVVVFYDGINDVVATLQDGVAGVPQNEFNRVAEFTLGRTLHPTTSGLGADLRAWAALARAGLGKLELTRRLQAMLRSPAPPVISADSAARDLLRVYTGNVRVVEALARSYGFQVVYVWQPSLHATPKVLTPYERQLMSGIGRNPFQQRLREVHAAVPALLDSAMATLAPGRFIDASRLFAGDTLSVFIDRIGHTTEAANPRIVDAFWPALLAVLSPEPPGSRARAAGP